MYSPLPSSPGPVTTSRLAAPLRGTVRLFNAALMALSLAVLASALWMFIVYHRTGLVPPAPTPAPNSLRFLLIDSSTSGGSLWFIYSVVGLGAFILATASSGMAGAQAERRHKLFMHIIMLSLLIILEAAALVVLVTENSIREKLPEDATGFWPQIEKFIDENARLVKIVGLGVILAQIVALGGACWLHSLYQAAYDDWIDGVEAAQARTVAQLNRTAEQAYTDNHSVWSTRMQEKYGVRAADWDATTAAAVAVQSAGLVNEHAPRSSGVP